MKLSSLIHNAHNLGTEELISKLPPYALGALMDQISKYYSNHLPMWRLLKYYGEDIGSDVHEQQISCPYPEHGTADTHKSARYYGYSRENDERESSIYCHKCHKRRTSLWLAYAKRGAEEEEKLPQVFVWIEKQFGVPFPAEMVLDTDDDDLLNLDPDGAPRQEAVDNLFLRAIAVRQARAEGADMPIILEQLLAIAESRI